jgi:hypothetical protein
MFFTARDHVEAQTRGRSLEQHLFHLRGAQRAETRGRPLRRKL